MNERSNLPPDRGLLLTVPEASAALRVSRWSLYRLIREGRILTIKIGSRRLVPRDAVDRLLHDLVEDAR